MVLIILLSAIGMKQALSEAQHRRWSEYGVLQCVGGGACGNSRLLLRVVF